MGYLRFAYNDREVILTPDIIKDIRRQLSPQIKEISFGELVETIEALGISPKNMIDFFRKVH